MFGDRFKHKMWKKTCFQVTVVFHLKGIYRKLCGKCCIKGKIEDGPEEIKMGKLETIKEENDSKKILPIRVNRTILLAAMLFWVNLKHRWVNFINWTLVGQINDFGIKWAKRG